MVHWLDSRLLICPKGVRFPPGVPVCGILSGVHQFDSEDTLCVNAYVGAPLLRFIRVRITEYPLDYIFHTEGVVGSNPTGA